MAKNDERPALTERQHKALEALRSNPGDAGAVASALGVSASGAYSHIQALKKKGYVNDDMHPIDVNVKKKRERPSKAVVTTTGTSNPSASASSTFTIDPQANGKVDAFTLDDRVNERVDEARSTLIHSIADVDGALDSHNERLAEISAQMERLAKEREEHLRAMDRLNSTRKSLEAALEAV